MNLGYDIIGDIHGYNEPLERLLEQLGYSRQHGVFTHPSRKVAFLGDFVDRGPGQRAVIETVRGMVETGNAVAVMGNHEFNAIAYHTPVTKTGSHLRPHSEKNRRQHQVFLDAYESSPDEYDAVLAWFRTLPLWLDLGDFRLVHACWDRRWVERLEAQYGGNRLTGRLLHMSATRGNWEFEAIETLLKGKEIPLRPGASFRDKDGTERHHIRVRWWDSTATTYRQAFMGPESALTHIPEDEIEGDHLVEYAHDEVPVFLGHYWLEGTPERLAPNIACLDYSVAKPGGQLTAYRWDGEPQLSNEKFVWVEQ